MSSRRRKEAIENEEAGLRALLQAYAKSHNPSNPSSQPNTQGPASNPNFFTSLFLRNKPTNPQQEPPQEAISDLDEVVKGKSISYTRREAKIYSNEEPCDSWRHFDVERPVLFGLIAGMVASPLPAAYGLRYLSLWIPSFRNPLLAGTQVLLRHKRNTLSRAKNSNWKTKEREISTIAAGRM